MSGERRRQFIIKGVSYKFKGALLGSRRAAKGHCDCGETGTGLLENCALALAGLYDPPFLARSGRGCIQTFRFMPWVGFS